MNKATTNKPTKTTTGEPGAEVWTSAELSSRRRLFVNSRERGVSWVGLALVFGVTACAAWGCSAAMLRMGLETMPLRYAIAFLVAYAVFFGCVRVWSDFQRDANARSDRLSDALEAGDVASSLGDAEGCGVVVLVAVIGFVLFVAFSWLGGAALLLEVAFEVIFAGTVVRSARGTHSVGEWYAVLLRATWWRALLIGSAYVLLGWYIQTRWPEVVTLGEGVRRLLP